MASTNLIVGIPFTAVAGGMRLLLRRIPVPAWAKAGLAIGMIGALVWATLRNEERRRWAARTFGPIGLRLIEEHSRGVAQRESGKTMLGEAIFVNAVDDEPLSLLMRRIATEPSPVTAAELWLELQPEDRRQLVSVANVRKFLHEMPVFVEVRRGRFQLGDQDFTASYSS